MRELVPPICLFIGLLCIIAAFALWAFGSPVMPITMHEAKLSGEANAIDAEEARFRDDTTRHYLLLAAFGGAGSIFTIAGYLLLNEAR